jgi:hypothetical protein
MKRRDFLRRMAGSIGIVHNPLAGASSLHNSQPNKTMNDRTFNTDEPIAHFITWTPYGTVVAGRQIYLFCARPVKVW